MKMNQRVHVMSMMNPLAATLARTAVVLIVVGSLLERGRVRIGLAVQRVSEILEEWE